MMPMPTDREKKACPNAPTRVSPLSLAGSIPNRKRRPSPAPGRVTE